MKNINFIIISSSALNLFNLTEDEVFNKEISFTFYLTPKDNEDDLSDLKYVEWGIRSP